MATDPQTSDRPAPSATDAARQTAESAKHEAQHLAGEAKQQARTMIDEQKNLAADQLDHVAEALRHSVDQLDRDAPGAFANYARRAVQGLDNCASALRDKNIDALLADAENFARRQPALFVAGSVAAGFALARFFKSSAQRSHGRHGGADRRSGGSASAQSEPGHSAAPEVT